MVPYLLIWSFTMYILYMSFQVILSTGLVITLITWIENAFMLRLYVVFQFVRSSGWIFTNVARIFHTFMIWVNMSFQMIEAITIETALWTRIKLFVVVYYLVFHKFWLCCCYKWAFPTCQIFFIFFDVFSFIFIIFYWFPF